VPWCEKTKKKKKKIEKVPFFFSPQGFHAHQSRLLRMIRKPLFVRDWGSAFDRTHPVAALYHYKERCRRVSSTRAVAAACVNCLKHSRSRHIYSTELVPACG
jgi:hypothetical protein